MFFTHRERERELLGEREREGETYQLPSLTPLPPLGVEGLLQVVYPQLQAEILFS